MRKAKEVKHYFSKRPESRPELGLIHVYLRGRTFDFLTASGVFSRRNVDLGTRLLIESMILPKSGRVLDVGCGYGAVGIVAAALCPERHVVMVDINARAVWLARRNIGTNNVDNAEAIRGNLYEPVRNSRFGCILSNPPISAGMKTVEAIIKEAPKHMGEEATFQIVVRSKIAGNRFQSYLNEAFGNFSILARESGYRVLIAKKS